TTICANSTGDVANPVHGDPVVPFSPRPGKTVTTAVTAGFDTNGDTVPDTTVNCTAVTVVDPNRIQGPLAPPPTGSNTGRGAFARFGISGGVATLTVTTPFGPGNNNSFNPLVAGCFTRSSSTLADTGARAPIITGSSATNGDSAVPQSLTLTGNDFT